MWRSAGAMGYPFGPMYQLLVLTGARLAEIAELRWSEIKDDVIELAGDRTKSGQEHTIPLPDVALNILAAIPHFCPYVFSTNRKRPVSGFSKSKATLDKRAAIPEWRTHDLRRTMASGMQKLGVQERVIEAVSATVAPAVTGCSASTSNTISASRSARPSTCGPNMSPAWPTLSVIGGVHSEMPLTPASKRKLQLIVEKNERAVGEPP